MKKPPTAFVAAEVVLRFARLRLQSLIEVVERLSESQNHSFQVKRERKENGRFWW